jgi:hypothetical protein
MMRRAVYTFVAFMSSKNNKKTAVSAPGKPQSFSSGNEKRSCKPMQLLILFNGAETRI